MTRFITMFIAFLLLIPLLPWLPLGMNLKKKFLLIFLAFTVAGISLLAEPYIPLWQNGLLSLILAGSFAYFFFKYAMNREKEEQEEYNETPLQEDDDERLEDEELTYLTSSDRVEAPALNASPVYEDASLQEPHESNEASDYFDENEIDVLDLPIAMPEEEPPAKEDTSLSDEEEPELPEELIDDLAFYEDDSEAAELAEIEETEPIVEEEEEEDTYLASLFDEMMDDVESDPVQSENHLHPAAELNEETLPALELEELYEWEEAPALSIEEDADLMTVEEAELLNEKDPEEREETAADDEPALPLISLDEIEETDELNVWVDDEMEDADLIPAVIEEEKESSENEAAASVENTEFLAESMESDLDLLAFEETDNERFESLPEQNENTGTEDRQKAELEEIEEPAEDHDTEWIDEPASVESAEGIQEPIEEDADELSEDLTADPEEEPEAGTIAETEAAQENTMNEDSAAEEASDENIEEQEIKPLPHEWLSIILKELQWKQASWPFEEAEQAIKGYLHASLHDRDYYTLAKLLLTFYLEQSKYEEARDWVAEIEGRLEHYPVIQSELQLTKSFIEDKI